MGFDKGESKGHLIERTEQDEEFASEMRWWANKDEASDLARQLGEKLRTGDYEVVQGIYNSAEEKIIYPSEERKSASPSSDHLKVFLCHSSGDKPAVRQLYERLQAEGIEPWLDAKNLLPGQDWELEIRRAVDDSHVVIVCISDRSVNKAGYLQKEIKFVLDRADEQPEGTIFVIPLKLEECEIPDRLSRWHWVNFFEEDGYELLMRSLRYRSQQLGIGL